MEPMAILLIEDEPFQVQILQTLFAMEAPGSVVVAAHTIKDAMLLASNPSLHFEAVILDLNLPDSTQCDTFFTWHSYCPDVPVLIYTALDDDSLATKCLAAGAQDFIKKPAPDLMPRACRHVIERWKYDKEIRKLKALYQSIIEISPELIVRFDRDCRVTFVNKKCCDVLGLTEDEIIHSCVRDFIPCVGDMQDFLAGITFKKKLSDPLELALGNEHYISWVYAGIFDEAGRIEEYQAIGRDITYKYQSTVEALIHLTDKTEKLRRAFNHKALGIMKSLDDLGKNLDAIQGEDHA